MMGACMDHDDDDDGGREGWMDELMIGWMDDGWMKWMNIWMMMMMMEVWKDG
jgi:hypothetical protein